MGQRVWKRQPAGVRPGGHRAWQADRVVGDFQRRVGRKECLSVRVAGESKSAEERPISDTCPRYITTMRSLMWRTTLSRG